MRSKKEFLEYSRKVKEIWNRFLHDKITRADIEVLPDYIYASWVRSRNYGLDPCQYTSYVKTRRMDNERRTKAFMDREYIKKFCVNLDDEYLFDISVFDEKINDIAFYYLKNRSVSSASERVAGTSAPALALLKKDIVYVLGPEHYSRFFHSNYCAAVPFWDSKGAVAGLINLNSETYEVIKSSEPLIRFLSNMCSSIYQKSEKEEKTLGNISGFIKVLPAALAQVNRNEIVLNEDAACMVKTCTQDSVMKLKELLKIGGRTVECSINKNEVLQARKISDRETIKSYVIEKKMKNKNDISRKSATVFGDIIGNTEALRSSIDVAKKIAKTDMSVMLLGESGTGKELFANAIHNESARKNEKFVALNCGAIASELIESELFGYEYGAFTDAVHKGKSGILELASGGTLFLDEIESMPVNAQIKLLRVLSSGKLLRVGAVNEVTIDVRVIAATKVDLFRLAYEGKFRLDLYFRISTAQITIPPLRERIDDVVDISQAFLKRRYGDVFSLDPNVYDALKIYNWPGNVRELENVLSYAAIFAKQNKNVITYACLPEYMQSYVKSEGIRKLIREKGYLKHVDRNTINDVKTEIICTALRRSGGNIVQAAAMLGVDRGTIYNKAKKDERVKEALRSSVT